MAQKYLKHFMQIVMHPSLVADLKFYNTEVAQSFNLKKPQKTEAFYKSIAPSFEKAVDFIRLHELECDFTNCIENILQESERQKWYNLDAFITKVEEKGS